MSTNGRPHFDYGRGGNQIHSGTGYQCEPGPLPGVQFPQHEFRCESAKNRAAVAVSPRKITVSSLGQPGSSRLSGRDGESERLIPGVGLPGPRSLTAQRTLVRDDKSNGTAPGFTAVRLVTCCVTVPSSWRLRRIIQVPRRIRFFIVRTARRKSPILSLAATALP